MFQGVYVMILLDTWALLWFLHDDPILPERVAEKIEKSKNAYEENLTLLTDDGKIRLYESVMQEW